MAQTEEQIISAALALPVQTRAKLAESLLESLLPPEQKEIDAAWAQEAERRIREYESGQVKSIPADEVLKPRVPPTRP
jgi:putative addiction module component (TIGR02574 family)